MSSESFAEQESVQDPHLEYNPYDPDVLKNPYPYYERMRATSPIYPSPMGSGYWGYTEEGADEHPVYLAIGYRELSAVLENPDLYTSEFKTGPEPSPVIDEVIAAEGGHPIMPTLYSMDPPEHTRRRRLLQRAMSAERIAASEPMTRAVADEIIDSFVADGRVELLTRYCTPFIRTALFEYLGMPRADHEQVTAWNEAFKEVCIPSSTTLDQTQACRDLVAYQRYFERAITERQDHPRPDLLGRLAEAKKAPDCPISTAEMCWGLMDMIGAGYGNTVESLANVLHVLLERPDQVERIRRDPTLISAAVEEGLRLEGPVHWLSRNTTREVELGDATMPAGALVVCAFSAANRDPSAFPDPDRFDLDRAGAGPRGRHLATGRGVHYCFGASWARTAMRIGIGALLDRLPGVRLPPGFQVSYNASAPMFRVVAELPVVWTPVG